MLGVARVSPSRSKSLAKFELNAFATGPPVSNFTYSASEEKPSGRSPLTRFVASITGTPSMPVTEPSASAIAADGTASRTASAPSTSPPSLPISTTSWPAARQIRASPPPTFPRPIVAIFISTSLVDVANRKRVAPGWAFLEARAAALELRPGVREEPAELPEQVARDGGPVGVLRDVAAQGAVDAVGIAERGERLGALNVDPE